MSVDDYVDFDPYWDYPDQDEDFWYSPLTFGEEYGTIQEQERTEDAIETSHAEFDNSGWGLSEASE